MTIDMAPLLSQNEMAPQFPRVAAARFHEAYDLGRVLGCGNTSNQVFECRKRTCRDGDDDVFAVKIVRPENSATILQEIDALRAVAGASGCVKIHEVFDERSDDCSTGFVYIVTEVVDGGSCLSLLAAGRCLRETEARDVARQMMTACGAMHSQGIVHRDIKPENILLKNKFDVSAGIRLADFGMAARVPPGELLHKPCGTPLFVAAEVVTAPKAASKGRAARYSALDESSGRDCIGYGTAADVWSCGVVLYNMLSGSYPFFDDDRYLEGLIRQIQTASVSFDAPVWKGVSSEAKDFIRQCLAKDPKKRLTAANALQHKWIVNGIGAQKTSIKERLMAML